MSIKSILSFDKVETTDFQAGMLVYANVESQVAELRAGIAPWLFRVAQHFFNQADCVSLVAGENFKAEMEKQIDWITSEKAGAKRMNAKDISLTGKSPFASAFKKIYGFLKLGGDMRAVTSASGCETWRVQENKRLEDNRAKQAAEEAIIHHCKVELLKEDKDFDFESEEGKLILSEAVAEYKAAQEKQEHLKVAADNKDVSSGKGDTFDALGKKLGDLARDLFKSKLKTFNGDEQQALEQVINMVHSVEEKWQSSIDRSKRKLQETLKKSA